MANLIRVESANMIYGDDYNVESVEIEFRYEGSVLRHGRGEIKLSHEEFVQEADVRKLEKRVIRELIGELEAAQTQESDE